MKVALFLKPSEGWGGDADYCIYVIKILSPVRERVCVGEDVCIARHLAEKTC
jgi:hypothetical protein